MLIDFITIKYNKTLYTLNNMRLSFMLAAAAAVGSDAFVFQPNVAARSRIRTDSSPQLLRSPSSLVACYGGGGGAVLDPPSANPSSNSAEDEADDESYSLSGISINRGRSERINRRQQQQLHQAAQRSNARLGDTGEPT